MFINHRIHLFHIPQCFIQNRNVRISVLNVESGDIEQVHSEILWNLSIAADLIINVDTSTPFY